MRISGASAALAGALAVAALVPLRAQNRPGPAASAQSAPQIEARREIAAFENVLENAVRYGAQMLIQHSSMTPPPANNIRYDVLLTGQARARGFRLAGYGAMFDVEFPSIRRSVAFTMSTLERPDPELLAALKELRRKTEGGADQQARQEMDRTIKSLEAQIDAYDTRAKNVSNGSASPAAAPEDPRTFYASQLINALMTAILEQGGATGITADEWLTVAARESLDFRFVPDDPATTLTMSVKGSDLAAFRDKRLTPEEARKRIDVRQY